AQIDSLVATGHDRRIDLVWESRADNSTGYDIYRSTNANGPFTKLNELPHVPAVYSDFLGENGVTRFYRVSPREVTVSSGAPRTVQGRSAAMRDEDFLESVQEATFRYFWHWGHPTSGLARERFMEPSHRRWSRWRDRRIRATCATGGTGFGLMAIVVGAERGFVTRTEAAARVLKIVRFLDEKAERFHGAWSHWIDGESGRTIPFARKNGVQADDGGDLVETSFLMQGMLTARQHFDRDDEIEREIRQRITRMWREVEWDWYLRRPDGNRLYWHWSPNHGWLMNHRIGGQFNECLITYLLALASPTHPIPQRCYEEGWIGDPDRYTNGNSYYGHHQWVGWPKGGRLFFTHYSFLGFDPRPYRDRYCNYFENNRNISLIHHAYSVENPKGHAGYGPLMWGLTSCETPDGYRALDPAGLDNGTIAPTAAIGAMPYTPKESMAALKHYYHQHGKRLWGAFGFRDAINLEEDWVAKNYLAIDQGPIICMIENHRSGLLWKLFMSNPEIAPMLKSIGWTRSHTVRSVSQSRPNGSPDRAGRRMAGIKSSERDRWLATLPDISEFKRQSSDRFLVDMEVVRDGFPYKGKLAEQPHTGGHVYFQPLTKQPSATDIDAFPAIYAVADGVIARIDYSFRLKEMFEPAIKRPVANTRYGIGLMFAKLDGQAVNFHYSIEPFIDPEDESFYEPFILVKPGQRVRKGEVIARMYLPSHPALRLKSHIHFNLTGGRSRPFMAPTIFDEDTTIAFHARWGQRGTDGGKPMPPTMGYRLTPQEDPTPNKPGL
ncbi:MAG: glucoamylase family protein, partial [Limisphaerales bacterium]